MARAKRTVALVAGDGSKSVGVVCCNKQFETSEEAETHERTHCAEQVWRKQNAVRRLTQRLKRAVAGLVATVDVTKAEQDDDGIADEASDLLLDDILYDIAEDVAFVDAVLSHRDERKEQEFERGVDEGMREYAATIPATELERTRKLKG